MKNSSFNSVMNKVQLHLTSKYNKQILENDIAETLGLSNEEYSNSKIQNQIPINALVKFCAKEDLLINHILFEESLDYINSSSNNLISVKYFRNVNISAGGGAHNEEEEFEYLGLDEEIISQIGGPSKLKYIEAVNVKGDSMEPVIKDGDIIFIDKSSNKPSHEKHDVYVVNTPNGMLVKVVTFIPHYQKLQLQSYNTLYPPEIYDFDEIQILGKVVGVS